MSEEDSKTVKVHKCKVTGDVPWTVENREEGWYLYAGDERGYEPVNFCPQCGVSLD